MDFIRLYFGDILCFRIELTDLVNADDPNSLHQFELPRCVFELIWNAFCGMLLQDRIFTEPNLASELQISLGSFIPADGHVAEAISLRIWNPPAHFNVLRH